MSEPIELAFREHLAAAFAGDFAGRVYDLVHPPDAALPLVTYRRTGSGGDRIDGEATMQITVKAELYTDAKRLQERIEAYMGNLRRTWLGSADNCVWVHLVTTRRAPDVYQPSTRLRLAVTDFVIKYA